MAKQKEQVARPSAIDVFRRAANRYPPKSWWKRVAAIVGEEEEDLEFWGVVVFYYVGQGWCPTNIDNMLQFYQQGKVPKHPELDRNKAGGPKKTISLADTRDPLAISL